MSRDKTILSVEGLSVEYRTRRGVVKAVDSVRFAIRQGAIVGLVGESGCGKTSVARSITGVLPDNARIAGGRIVFDGNDLMAMSEKERGAIRWRQISFVPQSAMNSLNPVHRVGAQIEEVLIYRGKMDRAAAGRRSREVFEMVGLGTARLFDYPHQFSGGMRQRAAIALALALDPKLVIADEPVTALDVIVQRQILDVVRELQERLALSMIMVTHDIGVVAYTCDYVLVMYAGQIVEHGPAGDVLAKPRHPYTMGLTNAFPEIDSDRQELSPIAGAPPDLLEPDPGCRFAPRCPFAVERCRTVEPSFSGTERHGAACHRSEEADALRKLAGQPDVWSKCDGAG